MANLSPIYVTLIVVAWIIVFGLKYGRSVLGLAQPARAFVDAAKEDYDPAKAKLSRSELDAWGAQAVDQAVRADKLFLRLRLSYVFGPPTIFVIAWLIARG